MALQTKIISANGSNGHHKFTLTVAEDSTSIANNTSSISWLFQLDPIQNGWDWYYNNAVSYSVVINGTTYSGTINSYTGSGTISIRSGSATITHNADGKKSISYSFSVSSYSQAYLPGSASASGSMTLTAIPRQATLTAAPDFNDEANPTITYSNPAGNSVDSLQACISLNGNAADVPYRDISKTGTSYTFNLTTAERNTLRNATTTSNSRTVSFHVKTVIGGQTFYHSIRKTLTIINAKPTLTVDAVDINEKTLALTGDAHKYIRNFSNVQTSATATALKGATITSTTGVARYNNITTNSFTFKTTDSRGNTTTKTYTGTLIPYTTISTTFKVQLAVNGTATITVSGNYYNGSFGAVNNALSIQYRYKKGSGSYNNWTSYTGASKSDGKYNATISFAIPNFDYQSKYTFQLHVSDKLLTLNPDPYTASAMPVFDWGEEDFNFNVPVGMNGNTILRYNDTVDNVVLSAGGGSVYIRPGGTDATDGEARLNTNGNLELKGDILINGKSLLSALRAAGVSI